MLLRSNHKVIVNSEIKQILHDPDSCHQLNENLKFLSHLDKCFFDYPLFHRDTWEPVLRQHNENLESDLTAEDLLGEHKDLHNALFHNYRTGEDYENIATGENKVWLPSDFEKQLKQLFGYLRVEGGFGFTIIFNKGHQTADSS